MTDTAPHASSAMTPATDSQGLRESEPWDVIIVGGGAAGLSAALILARARRRVLVLDGQAPRNRFTAQMHGVLSRDGYSPLDLVADGYREVRAVDGVIVKDRASQARQFDEGFEIVTEKGARVVGRRLIIATGARDVLPEIPGLAEQWGRGVVACPYCDGYEAVGRRIGVLLGSAAGAHKAHMLRSYSSEVTVFTAMTGGLAEPDRRALEQRGMQVEHRQITRVVSEEGVLAGLAHDDGTTTAVDVVFAEPGLVAIDELLQQLGAERTESPFGAWTAVDSVGRTSVPGVWAVGNVGNPTALVPVAMGAGAGAALAINGEFVAEEIAAAHAALSENRRG